MATSKERIGRIEPPLTDEQRAKNLGSGIRKLWDFNPGIGGPIKQDKLWFFFSYRTSGQDADSGVRYNATPTAWVYTPDLSQPNASIRVTDRNYSTRLTWQLSPRVAWDAARESGAVSASVHIFPCTAPVLAR